jgi:sugar transferase (PEP-CTERM/EpsH1 system associated)
VNAALPLVAHVVHRFDYGGLENGVANLVNGLPADRYRQAIVGLAGIGAFRERVRRPEVELVSMDKREGKDPAAYTRLWRWLRARRPAIVHTRNVGTVDCQWVAWAAGVPGRVHGEHGWEASDPFGTESRPLRLRRLCRPVIQRYVPMSRDLGRWLQDTVGVPRERIRQLYSGVDVHRFCPGRGPTATATGAGDQIVIGTVGRLDPVKNQAALVGALRRIHDRDPGGAGHLKLIIVGDGPMRAALEDRVQGAGLQEQVSLVGARQDVPELMRRMDVFALPSTNEGISNTVLEAMASGLPVVATRVGGNPELVVDGVTGALVAPGDEAALAEALARYAGDAQLRRTHGAAGRARAVEEFSIEAMMKRYCDLYDEVLGL